MPSNKILSDTNHKILYQNIENIIEQTHLHSSLYIIAQKILVILCPDIGHHPLKTTRVLLFVFTPIVHLSKYVYYLYRDVGP